ncbi:hypothetical protein KGA65_14670 [Ideonella sp. B7]|uniref:hypothetical protein n=1 Tax=Ideonella benzenivorans TaxID=2831643 RepID=UPI001CEDD463|nr:hypothetical protein [Ideonella benzenivorans]MCA6217777.1 hypothetical protein [Ideonella benzenivorans]
MSTEQLHAKGPNGESCIIERISASIDTSNLSGRSSLTGLASYRLATGERLNPTEDPKVFASLDGQRRYSLT